MRFCVFPSRIFWFGLNSADKLKENLTEHAAIGARVTERVECLFLSLSSGSRMKVTLQEKQPFCCVVPHSLLPLSGAVLQLPADIRLLFLLRHPQCVAGSVPGGEWEVENHLKDTVRIKLSHF